MSLALDGLRCLALSRQPYVRHVSVEYVKHRNNIWRERLFIVEAEIVFRAMDRPRISL
jgi:hypothetical protein